MKKEIYISPSPTADTRTAAEPVTKEQLFRSSIQHIDDVRRTMQWMRGRLMDVATKHDYSKVDNAGIAQFHADFAETQRSGADFTQMAWYQRHIAEERHHLDKRVPDDVNLFDVLERIADRREARLLFRWGALYVDPAHPFSDVVIPERSAQ